MSDVSAVVLLTPVIVTMMAVVIFREEVDARRWLAVLVGFAGVLFIIRPAPASFNAWAIVALGAAVASSIRDVLTRKLDPAIPTTVLAFTSMVALTLVGVGLGLSGAWLPLSANECLLLLGGAAFLGLAIYFVAMAFRGGEISVVTPFRYTSLLWAGTAGFVGFGEIPGAWSLAGAALIVASGLYVLHRDAERSRRLGRPLRHRNGDGLRRPHVSPFFQNSKGADMLDGYRSRRRPRMNETPNPNRPGARLPRTIWYTRCPVPTASGIAIQKGWLKEAFAADGIAIRSMRHSQDPKTRESHYTHTLDRSRFVRAATRRPFSRAPKARIQCYWGCIGFRNIRPSCRYPAPD